MCDTFLCVCIYIYMYSARVDSSEIHRERERDREPYREKFEAPHVENVNQGPETIHLSTEARAIQRSHSSLVRLDSQTLFDQVADRHLDLDTDRPANQSRPDSFVQFMSEMIRQRKRQQK